MEKKTCKTCGHFRQHYIKYANNFFTEVNDGHCVYPMLKNRKSLTPACDKYVEASEASAARGSCAAAAK